MICVWTPLEPHVLEALREKKVRCLLWQGEPPIDNARWAPSFDHCEHVFVIEEGYLEYFPAHVLPKVSILPLATNDSVHYSLEEVSPQFVSEVSFIGLYRHGRADILSVLQEFDIKIYGHGWEEGFESFPWLKKAYQGPLTAEQTNEVFNGAQISIGRLALGFTPEVGQTTNQRVFDISCANAFQLTQYIPSTEKFFGDAVVTFDSKESLHNLAKHYLDHQEERKILAKRAHAITLKNHTYRARIEEIFRIINITQ